MDGAILWTNYVSHDWTAGIEAFLIPKNESVLAGTNRLVKDRSRKSGSIPEWSLAELASVLV